MPTLAEVLALLKDKVYINVDKFWTDVEGIAKEIRKAGVEKQVIVKTYVDEKSLEAVTKYAPDFMFMPLIWAKDTVTDSLLKNGVNVIGAELLFDKDTTTVAIRDTNSGAIWSSLPEKNIEKDIYSSAYKSLEEELDLFNLKENFI